MSQRMYRRYMRVLLAWIFVLVALVATGNWLMDPFALFGSPDWQGFNRIKPEIVKNDRAAKARMIERQRPTALILGNSRSLNGIPTPTTVRGTGRRCLTPPSLRVISAKRLRS